MPPKCGHENDIIGNRLTTTHYFKHVQEYDRRVSALD